MPKILIPVLTLLTFPWVSVTLAEDAVPVAEDKSRAVYEKEIEANVEAVWQAFTTSEGLVSWMAPLAEIDLQIGGTMRANYVPEGQLGDPSTIENTILAFDPQRMLAFKASGFPAGFEFEEVARKTWSVFYFEALGPSRTRITIVGLGYTEEAKSQEMRSFFARANEYSFSKLQAALAK